MENRRIDGGESSGGTLKQRRLLSALVATALVLAACSSGTDSETSTSAANEPTTTATAEADGISTADTGLGTILVDGDGFALYVFTPDTDGESTCYEGCADVWPPVPGDAAIGSGVEASLFGSVARTDGGDQLTVNGQPLYRYTPDANPGDTGGQGVNGVWFVVDADGAMVGAPQASSDSGTETSDDGLDY